MRVSVWTKIWLKVLIGSTVLFFVIFYWGSPLFAASMNDELKGEPKLMVTDIQISSGTLVAGQEATLTVTIRNTNGSRYIKNAIFTFSESSS